MRVALLGPYPLAGRPSGGPEVVMMLQARAMAERPTVDLHVVTAVPGLARTTTEQRGKITLHCVPHGHGERLLWHYPVVQRLCRTVADIAPDVVHAHMTGPYAGAAVRSGRPAVITPHGITFREAALAWPHSTWPTRARWLIDAYYEKWVMRQAREVIAISPYIRTEFHRLTRARFHDVEVPIDDVFFDTPPQRGSTPRLLCVGQVVARKNVLGVIEAFARVRRSLPAAELHIAGPTDVEPLYVATCQQAVARWELGSSVHFLGNLAKEALASSFAQAHVSVLASWQETAPAVIMQAMAAGCAVVATRVGGVPFIVSEGVTGLLVPPGDVDALAAAILTLVTQPTYRATLATAARQDAEARYRLARVVDRTLAVYAQISGRGS